MLRGFKDLLGYGSKVRAEHRLFSSWVLDLPHPQANDLLLLLQPLGIPSHDQSDHDNDLPDAPSPTSNSTAARLPDDDLDIHPHKPQDVSPAVVDLPTAASTEAAPSYTKSRAWASNGEEELGSRRKPRLQTKYALGTSSNACSSS